MCEERAGWGCRDDVIKQLQLQENISIVIENRIAPAGNGWWGGCLRLGRVDGT